MGSFSWMRADKATKRSNFIYGDPYKILIPKEFGGFIKDTFGEFGKVFYGKENEADLYGILAYWNKCEGMEYSCDHYPCTMEEILKYGNTCSQNNRSKGIDIGCYDKDIAKLIGNSKQNTKVLRQSALSMEAAVYRRGVIYLQKVKDC